MPCDIFVFQGSISLENTSMLTLADLGPNFWGANGLGGMAHFAPMIILYKKA
jgi:hypothetical protein